VPVIMFFPFADTGALWDQPAPRRDRNPDVDVWERV
jgi:hypothetical protein